MTLFQGRPDAGRELAAALDAWSGTGAVVVGVARGGIPVGAEVARLLRLPLTAIAVRKLGTPGNEEFALGAIADGVRVVVDDALRRAEVSAKQLADIERRERVTLDRREELIPGSVDLAGRTALVVDDGVATGATAEAACRAVRSRGAARVVLAVPVAPASWRPSSAVVDEWVCPHRQREFWSVGRFYADFRQTSDAEVARLLGRNDPGVPDRS
jgi:putative phosphoribosyl transferase